jgi:hypothetical protein
MEMMACARGTRTEFLVEFFAFWSHHDDIKGHGQNIQDALS